MRRRVTPSRVSVWPAFTDAMLAFLLSMVLIVAFLLTGFFTYDQQYVDLKTEKRALLEELQKMRAEFKAQQEAAALKSAGELRRMEDQQRVKALVARLGQQYDDVTVDSADGTTQTIRLGANALFNSGEAWLTQRGKNILAELVKTILDPQHGVHTLREIQVAGHTDNVPTGSTSRWTSNWQLSSARALEVVNFLENQGIDPKAFTLSATGYSEFVPIATNLTRQGRSRNRRVEIQLVYTDRLDGVPEAAGNS